MLLVLNRNDRSLRLKYNFSMDDLSSEDSASLFEDEQELISQLRQMDDEAISWVWNSYYAQLVRYATRLTRNPGIAEELVSMVFHRLLESLHRGKGPKRNIRPYLYKMTYHTVIDQSRTNIESVPMTDVIPEDNPAPQETVERVDQIARINSALDSLTDDQRNLIILRFVEELTMRETADVMDKTINAIKSMQRRAVNSFRNTPEFKDLAKKDDE